MKQKEAAVRVLREKGRPMHVNGIAQGVKGLIESNNPDVKNAIASQILSDIKKLGDQSLFVKVAKARYGLREWPARLLDEGAHVTRKSNSDGAGRRSDGPMTQLDAAYEILLGEGGPLHKNEIAKRVKERGLIKYTVNPRIGDFIAARIGTEIRKMGKKSRFFKEKASTYGLCKYGGTPPAPDRDKDRAPGLNGPPQESKGPDYTGPAGEHRVQSELLFRGYQTSKPEPDIGVDIVANKDGKEFYIQVKSSNRDAGSYHYNIKKRSFERTRKKNVYYVFIMRNPLSETAAFVIMPNSEMLAMIKADNIPPVKRGGLVDSYQVNLKIKSGAVYCGSKNVSKYKNAWPND